MRRILLIALILLLALPIALYASSQASLDSSFPYSRAAQALPLLRTHNPDGLVRIPARGMFFRARVAGLQNTGAALVLLHGFPETSIMWEPLIEAAAAAGFRVVAFDQRGYSPEARPAEISSYQVTELTTDVFAIADALGFERFHLVGHDWGSIVGWISAGEAPQRVRSFASLSIPHLGAIAEANASRGTPTYVQVFRSPRVPETLFTAGGLYVMRNALYTTMSDAHRAEYLALFSEPGGLEAALNWYRAMSPLGPEAGDRAQPISQPTLHVFGSRDLEVFVRPAVIELQPKYVTGSLTSLELDAGHWLIQEAEVAVVDAVMRHLLAQPN